MKNKYHMLYNTCLVMLGIVCLLTGCSKGNAVVTEQNENIEDKVEDNSDVAEEDAKIDTKDDIIDVFTSEDSLPKDSSRVINEGVQISYAYKEIEAIDTDDKVCVLDDSEYSVFVELNTKDKIEEVCIYSIMMNDIDEDGNAVFEGERLYKYSELMPDESLYLQMCFPGDTPDTGISYKNANGQVKYYSIYMSGYDGSVKLGEESAFNRIN